MKSTIMKNFLHALLVLALPLGGLADRIELADGSVIHGKILSAEAGFFKVDTAFAATIVIKQDQIKSFTTDEAVNVQLGSGSTLVGRVQAASGGIAIEDGAARLASSTAQVSALWRPG